MKKILAALFLIASGLSFALPASAATDIANVGDWRQHNTFDYYLRRVVETPSRVYMLGQDQGYWSNLGGYDEIRCSLFVYDKETDEVQGYNAVNYLHGKAISDIYYNAAKRYLLIVYTDYNIDILYDDDSCYNVPGLASVLIPGGKNVRTVSFDPELDKAYVATDFGYFVIDDSRNLISESHIYNKPINQICRVGDTLVAAADEGLFTSPVNAADKHGTWSSFKKMTNSPSGATFVVPFGDDTIAYVDTGNKSYLYKSSGVAKGEIESEPKNLYASGIVDIAENRDGYFVATQWEAVLLNKTEGTSSSIAGSSAYKYAYPNPFLIMNAWTPDALWVLSGRNGLKKFTYADKKLTAVVNPTHGEWIRPDANGSSPAGSFSYSPDHGMLAINDGFSRIAPSNSLSYRNLITGYKDGTWTPYSIAYNTSDPLQNLARNTGKGAVDPSDPDVVWFGSFGHGLFRENIKDLSLKMYTRSGDNTSKANVFSVFPLSPGWTDYCCVGSPSFDADETLWAIHSTEWLSGNPNVVYYWKKADRLANKTSEFKGIPIPGFLSQTFNFVLPLKAPSNKNRLAVFSGQYGPGFWILDHKGTLDNSADDEITHITDLIDQDGSGVNAIYYYCATEDPATGYVWVGTSEGLFYFNPADVGRSDFHLYRVKIARNDGTGLADYLLEGSTVTDIKIDGAAHKWFATLENGVVETNATGTQILNHFNTDNSFLPSNDVYSIGIDPSSSSVWLGTRNGVAQYFSASAPSADNLDDVIAYPNPVRPEYYGFVTIQGLMDGSLVKIMDAAGNLVRDLGRSEGGMVQWDLSNLSGRRVPTGVYYVACSASGDNSDNTVTKILVMN